jgi:hypothetical protein
LTIGALAIWAALLVLARVWGLRVVHDAVADLHVGAVPLFGAWRWVITARLLVPIALGTVLVVALPLLARRWSWRGVLGAVAVAAVVWAGALAYVDPANARWGSIHDDYGQHIDRVEQQGLGGFLRDYVGNQKTFPTHLKAHPPGMVVVLWTASRLGLRGEGFEVALALLGVAAGAVAALVALGEVAGTSWARRAAPFVVLAPAAIWHTNADVFVAGVVLTAVALIVRATGRSGTSMTVHAVAGGVLFGSALLLSYGVVLLALPAAVVAVARRRFRPLSVAAAATAVVLLLPVAWGFSWIDGLAATKHEYDLNLATVRPYSYFIVANLAVFALAVGPAIAVGLTRLRDRLTWLLVGSGLAVVLIADITGLSSAETERIWQPFMPLVLLAGAAVSVSVRSTRRWLTAQVAVAIIVQAALRSPW